MRRFHSLQAAWNGVALVDPRAFESSKKQRLRLKNQGFNAFCIDNPWNPCKNLIAYLADTTIRFWIII